MQSTTAAGSPGVRAVLSSWRTDDPKTGNLKDEMTDSETVLSFYLKWSDKKEEEPYFPSYRYLSTLVDSQRYEDCGHLLDNANYDDVATDTAQYVARFVERSRALKVCYAVAGIAFLFGTHSNSLIKRAYPIFVAFPATDEWISRFD